MCVCDGIMTGHSVMSRSRYRYRYRYRYRCELQSSVTVLMNHMEATQTSNLHPPSVCVCECV